ncbi:UNVERIFIED_CONTAM: hypothetical protein FKN15_053530 [Acipenser sinensis]
MGLSDRAECVSGSSGASDLHCASLTALVPEIFSASETPLNPTAQGDSLSSVELPPLRTAGQHSFRQLWVKKGNKAC